MKNNIGSFDSIFFEDKGDKSSNVISLNQQRFSDFNAVVGMFIIFSLFFTVFAAVLITFGLDVNVFPFVVAITVSAVVGIILFLVMCYQCD